MNLTVTISHIFIYHYRLSPIWLLNVAFRSLVILYVLLIINTFIIVFLYSSGGMVFFSGV